MTLAVLDGGRVDAYLARLGVNSVQHDPAGLAALQAAHLMAVPFHNLLLLANDGRPWGLQPLHQVVDDAIAGVGGNCDRTTPPFAALLESLGFDVHLAAATIREPGDHFVSIVRVGGSRFLCDVGNGHPYLRPWDLDGPAQEQSFHGWSFRFEPRGPNGPTLLRDLGPDGLKTVYVVDTNPCAYQDFAPMVTAHYTQAGFGPFLSGLRAVRIEQDMILTLRDGEYARDSRFGRSARPVFGRDAVRSLLIERFGLSVHLVDDAMEVMGRRRPDLLDSEPRWFALGRGIIEDSEGMPVPDRRDVPDVLVTLASIGRTASVQRVLQTLGAELRESRYPGRVGVLLVENTRAPADRASVEAAGIPVHRVAIADVQNALDRAVVAGVLSPLDDLGPLPIGAAREAQLAAVHGHLRDPIRGLPHPSEHPTVVWMIDDDVTFQQLGEDGEARRRTHLLFRVARFWSTLPQHSVVLGTLTGDPPVLGLDTLGGQLRDLAESMALLVRRDPDSTWDPPPSPEGVFDAYYDLSEAAPPDASLFWPYRGDLPGGSVRRCALALLRDLPKLLDGRQLTRAMTWLGNEAPPRASLRRGGNTLFLDFDALFRWPTPVMTSGDGVVTRRADTLWAALAQKEDPGVVVEATLPLHHRRDGQADDSTRTWTSTLPPMAALTSAQVRGIVLSRALAEGRSVPRELVAREERVTAHRQELTIRVAALREALKGLRAWGDAEIDAAVTEAHEVLSALGRHANDSTPIPGDPDELTAFLERLPQAVREWRCAW